MPTARRSFRVACAIRSQGCTPRSRPIAALVIRDRTGDRHAGRVHDGGVGTERGRRDAARILAQRNPDAPARKSRSGRDVRRACIAVGATTNGSRSLCSTTRYGRAWRRSSVGRNSDHDDRADDEAGRRYRADEIDKLIADWTASARVSDAVRALREHGVAAARRDGAARPADDPHLLARGFWETVDHPVVRFLSLHRNAFRFVGRTSRLGSDATACLRPAHQRGADGHAGADRRRSGRVCGRQA